MALGKFTIMSLRFLALAIIIIYIILIIIDVVVLFTQPIPPFRVLRTVFEVLALPLMLSYVCYSCAQPWIAKRLQF